MNTFKLIGFLAITAIIGLAFTSPTTIFKVNPSKSTVVWTGYKVTGSHTGTIGVKEGGLEYTDDALTGGSFIIDMASLVCTDLAGTGMEGKLEGHLKSADFFGVETYPTAKFEITKVISRGQKGDYKIKGNLTIKETTKEIRFKTSIIEEDGAKVATTKVTIDRSDFDIRYGSGSFFDNLGDKTIYDEFDLEIKLVVE